MTSMIPTQTTRHDATSVSNRFLQDVLRGLSTPRKTLPSKYFYDAEGSRLFEAICEQPEYYLTRTETALLAGIAHELAGFVSDGAALVEFGSGASAKTRLILDASPQIELYVPIDISHAAISQAAEAIKADYRSLTVMPLVEDFTGAFRLPPAVRSRPIVGFFSGSTIGNFQPADAERFLRRVRKLLGDGALLVVGADLVKAPEVLLPAYDDANGVTAAFNRNLLVRINRELGGSLNLDAFDHRAIWNEAESRIEMHLISNRDQTARIGNRTIVFMDGEVIHTENSHKYRPESFEALVARSGWRVKTMWASDGPSFGVFLLETEGVDVGVDLEISNENRFGVSIASDSLSG
jgi:dimethylhistidine N-methyltransferase